MNVDELFCNFCNSAGIRSSIPDREYWCGVFNRVVGPYLGIPRSIKDDPPKSGLVLLFRIEPGGRPIAISARVNECNFGTVTAGWTWWAPFPELPAVDKDEQEFEEWFKAHESEYCTDITKAALKHGWMAARGKK